MSVAIHRADLALIGTAATATGVSNAIRSAVGGTGAEGIPGATVRFLEAEVFSFPWHGATAYLTPTDLIALASALILVVRFAAWAVAPVVGLFRRGRNGGT